MPGIIDALRGMAGIASPFDRYRAMKPYEFRARGEDAGDIEVTMYGEVVEKRPYDWWTGKPVDGLFIVRDEFLAELERYGKAKNITFRINSIGGDAMSGITIYNRMKELGAHTVAIIDGLAASAASVIAMAADEVRMGTGTMIMIHGAASPMLGYYNASELSRELKAVNEFDSRLAEIYAERTGMTKARIANMMTGEKWMGPAEAVELGFADFEEPEEEPEVAAVASLPGFFMVNGVPLHRYGYPMPERAMGKECVSCGMGPLDIDAEENPEAKGGGIMDLQKLKEAYPELCEQLAGEARQAALAEAQASVEKAVAEERERIAGLDELSGRVDPKMLKEAKYGENPMDAKTLAFEALRAEKAAGEAAGKAFLAARHKETVASISASPVDGAEGVEEMQKRNMEEAGRLFASVVGNIRR